MEYHHTIPIQLRWNDVDRFGHVNNEVYFSFYDLGKSQYFAHVCPHVNWRNYGIVAVSDHIAVQTAVTEIGNKSFHLSQRVIDLDTQEVKCMGTSVMVTYDLVEHESMPLKWEWIEAICRFEGKDVRRNQRKALQL